MSVKRKVNYTNEYAVIVPNSLGMLLILFTNILINLTIRSFQCEFVSSKKYTIATPLRRQKEDYRIRELGTVMDIFNSVPRRKRSHGHRHYTFPICHDVSLNDLLPFMQKPLGMHHIRSKLFALPLSKLHTLYTHVW